MRSFDSSTYFVFLVYT